MSTTAVKRLSYAAYLEQERGQDVRHEWYDGQAVAMAGGTRLHAQLQARLLVTLANALAGRDCTVYGSDLMVRAPTGLATYPDVTVVCGRFVGDDDNPDAATNPTLLVEVLSPSTESWDRGGKLLHTRAIPSLKHVVLVNTDWQCLEWYSRGDEGAWVWRQARCGGVVDLPGLGIAIDVDQVYADTDVPADGPLPLRVGEPRVEWGVGGATAEL